MLLKRNRQDRGYANHGWLESYHTFSFANYYDPQYIGFSSLRVINEDRIQDGGGFATHCHRDMESITYVLAGQLEHKDSLGNGSVIEPGKIQRMTAGTGIAHSEYNASQSEPVHMLQIWILPNQSGLAPSYEEKAIDLEASQGQFQLIATPSGEQGTITIHQDATLAVPRLQAGQSLTQAFNPQRHGWLQVSQGQLSLNGLDLDQGDGVAIRAKSSLALSANGDCEVLLFDLP